MATKPISKAPFQQAGVIIPKLSNSQDTDSVRTVAIGAEHTSEVEPKRPDLLVRHVNAQMIAHHGRHLGCNRKSERIYLLGTFYQGTHVAINTVA